MPELWPHVELSSLVVEARPICYGVLKPGGYFSNGIPLIRILDIENDRLNEHLLWRISPELDAAFKRSRLDGGELLLSIQGTIGRVALAPSTAAGANISRTIARISIDPSKADARFLRHWLRSNSGRRTVDDVTVGTTRSSLNINNLRTIRVPKPSLEVQSKTGDILDALDDAILETDVLIAKLRTVDIAVIDDLLTRGLKGDGSPRDHSELQDTLVGRRPPKWLVANLGQFVVGAEYGTNLSLGDSSAGIPVLRMNNIHDGEFDLSDLKYAPARAVERFRLQRDDVLFNRTNSWEHVGKAAIWRRDEPGPAFASYLVRLHCGDALLPAFLHLWLNWAPVQRAIRQFATPGVQQVNINPTNLRRALIAVPDTLDEQRAIIERVNGVAAAIKEHRRERAKLSLLREGLRDDLLTGRQPVVAIREAAE